MLPLHPLPPNANQLSCPLLFIYCLQQVGLEDGLNSIMMPFCGKYVAREHCGWVASQSSSEPMRLSKTKIALAYGAHGMCGSRRCTAGLRG